MSGIILNLFLQILFILIIWIILPFNSLNITKNIWSYNDILCIRLSIIKKTLSLSEMKSEHQKLKTKKLMDISYF